MKRKLQINNPREPKCKQVYNKRLENRIEQ